MIGATASIFSALYFFSRGDFVIGVCVTAVFILSDLLDGTMARLSGKGSRWGALLDSTLDRFTDSAVLGSLAYYLAQDQDRLLPIVLIALVSGGMVSYIKARAEALDIPCNGGFAERTERLLIALGAILLSGLGINYALAAGMWFLALASVYTCIERLVIVYKASK
jgi:CDP-diacylglycerol--glycerol-3-phosphate 3-phosphatidyltransferase